MKKQATNLDCRLRNVRKACTCAKKRYRPDGFLSLGHTVDKGVEVAF